MTVANSLLAACLLTTTACSLIPDYQRPKLTMTDTWKNSPAAKDEKIAADWWRSFNSPPLNDLITQALAQNNDVRAAVARIKQARATANIAGATAYPFLTASGNAGTTRANPVGSGARTTRSSQAGLDASYIVDLFGSESASRAEANANLAATVFDHDALTLLTMSEVAQTYFQVLTLREQVHIAKTDQDVVGDVMNIINARYSAGTVSGLEVAQQKATVQQTNAALAALVQQESSAENALAVLVARPPQDFSVTGDSLKPLTIPEIAPVQPWTLLTRRPDIRAAEERLVAANADIGIARAALFPSLTVGATVGIASTSLTGPYSNSTGLLASLTAPIFEGGSLRNRVKLSEAQKEELVENYRKTILVSLQEVQDAIALRDAAQQRVKSLQEAETQTETAYDLSLKLYKAGAADFQTLLDAQRDLLNSRDSYIAAQFDLFSASVALFKAMGGGWQEENSSVTTYPL